MPKSSPQASASMTPAQIIKSGAIGMADARCAKIFAQFSPPIRCGTYNDVSREGGCQAEHPAANSNFQSSRGDNSTNIPGAPGYSEGGAPAFNVFDDQSAGTEHKFLTDAARDFANSMRGKPFTLKDNLDHMQKKWEEMFKSDNMERSPGGGKRSRIKGRKTKKQKAKLAKQAAECIRQHCDRVYQSMGAGPNTPLRNGMATGNGARNAARSAATTGARRR